MKRPNLQDYQKLSGEDLIDYIMAWNEYGNALQNRADSLAESLIEMIEHFSNDNLSLDQLESLEKAKQELNFSHIDK